MKSLFPALLLCLSTLAVAHQEQEPPALDLVRLQQEVTQEVGDASAAVVADALENLRQPDISIMVTKSRAEAEPRG
ncbi:hypothetical protein [Aeromonas simiae]|uniref:hypothetical protein n=1 Tax=Aeromonas simiae TaxID=218936 RepID=UPI0005AA6AD0|nr:hypothetical protein [Aeromonas simiae]MDO2950080.1 hypothetical protein [Aeromonas simiae]MDO2953775.1 hypothetical protein [Aeromonas simiae]MDO2957456.1 hypothetical protein [Aeromonas simiae]